MGWLETRKATQASLALVFVIALLVFTGWALHFELLKSVLPGFVSMKANTAIGLTLLAAAGWLLKDQPVKKWRRRAGGLLALLTFALGAATLMEYVLGHDYGIDELLFADPAAMNTRWPPGRFAPITCVNFIMIGTALLLDGSRRPARQKFRQGLLIVAWIISFQAFIGYLCGVTYSFGSAFYTQIAMHTAIAFAALCTGLLLSRADEGYTRLLMADDMAGRVGRRLLLSAIVVPPLVNWLQLQGQHLGFYDADFGVLLRVVGNVVFFAWMALKTTTSLVASERRTREAETKQAEQNERLQKAVKARDEFLMLASHELRTPLAALKFRAEMGRRVIARVTAEQGAGAMPEKLARFADQVDRQVGRLARLVDDMLDISHIDSGRLTLSVEHFDLVDLVVDVLKRFDDHPMRASIRCEDGPRPVFIEADRNRVDQVVVNLLTNALRYGNGQPVQVLVRDDDESAVIMVEDGGVGIKREDRERIFERFERAVEADQPTGLGLGLYITKQIVQAHGGAIEVSSEPGRGACFSVRLPKRQAAAGAPIEDTLATDVAGR